MTGEHERKLPPPGGIVQATSGEVDAGDILAVRRGPGANCSSIGSALDLLFLSSVAAGVVLAGVAAAFGGDSPARQAGQPDPDQDAKEPSDAGAG